jgi:hypothetical protein
VRVFLNQDSLNKIEQKIKDVKEQVAHASWTLSNNKVAAYIVSRLLHHELPYKVLSAGAGVKVITTDTAVCPLCKQPHGKNKKQPGGQNG